MSTVATSPRRRRSGTPGPDGITVTFLTLAAFLSILAVLAWQVRSAPARPAHRTIVLRRVYETRVIETVAGGTGRGGSTVSQSVSSSGSASSQPSAPTTRAS